MFISLLFILFFISEFFNNSECAPKRRGGYASSSKRDYQSFLNESTEYPSSSIELRNKRRREYSPIYSDNKWSSDFGEENFEQGELVVIKNIFKRTKEVEILVAIIVGKEKEIIVEVKGGPLSGKLFKRNLNEIRKYVEMYEIVEILNDNEWIEGIIFDFENGEYILMIVNGPFFGQIFKRNGDGLRKIMFNINEIVVIKNLNKITKKFDWIKAKIIEKLNKNEYNVEIVDNCALKGIILTRSPFALHKHKIEKFKLGETVEVEIFNKIEKKILWDKATVVKIKNELYTVFTEEGKNIENLPSYYIRKIIKE